MELNTRIPGGITTYVVLGLALAFSSAAWAEDDTESLVVIKAGRVITVSGAEHTPGIIVIEDGKITGVGKDIEYPLSARVIQAPGETVMPGLIHARTRYGLPPYQRSEIHGDQSASSEMYLELMSFDDVLEAGYTSMCYIPAGDDIPGVSAVYRTGGPMDQRLVTDRAYLQVAPEWNAKGKANLREAFKKAKEEIEKVQKANEEWEKKRKQKDKKDDGKAEEKKEEKKEDNKAGSYLAGGSVGPLAKLPPEVVSEMDPSKADEFKPPSIDPKYQPLVDLIQKKEDARMMVQLTSASDLHHLDEVLKPFDNPNYLLYLATALPTDYNHVVRTLGERKTQIVLRPWIHFLPDTTFRYDLMDKLVRAGCEVSVVPWFDTREEFIRLRLRLAELIRAGLSREDALKSLTLNPARVMGLEKRIGSIEKEKEADLVFFLGDPLDPHSRVSQVWIAGERVWKANDRRDGTR